MNELDIAFILDEMEKFNRELVTKFMITIHRRGVLNVSESWITLKQPLDYLIQYYNTLSSTSEKQIKSFLEDMVIENYKNKLHDLLKTPSFLEQMIPVPNETPVWKPKIKPETKEEQVGVKRHIPKRRIEKVTINAKCGFCFTMIPIGEPHIEHTKYCEEAERLYALPYKNAVDNVNTKYCIHCKNEFCEPSKLKKHLKICKGNVKRYFCEVCNKWKPESNRKNHQYHEEHKKHKPVTHGTVYSPKEVIPTKDNPLGCAICGITMTSKSQYDKHFNEGCI